jgi:hypothetical protein
MIGVGWVQYIHNPIYTEGRDSEDHLSTTTCTKVCDATSQSMGGLVCASYPSYAWKHKQEHCGSGPLRHKVRPYFKNNKQKMLAE